jgi:hypothetical protein
MRVREQHVGDGAHLRETQVADAGAGIDQQFVVDKQAGGPQIGTYTAAATEHFYPHLSMRFELRKFSSKIRVLM